MTSSAPTDPNGVEELRACLARIGAEHFGTYPWHTSDDPYVVLICELLLKRTKRVVVARVLPAFLEAYPTARDLAQADPDELYERIRPVGLARRTRRLPLVGKALVDLGAVPMQRDRLLGLPEVGEYVADAMRLYTFEERAFPLDRNVQRVLVRVQYGCQPDRTVDPYKDSQLGTVLERLLAGRDASHLRLLHQGILAIAWSHCGPHPQCESCPINGVCTWNRNRPRASGDG